MRIACGRAGVIAACVLFGLVAVADAGGGVYVDLSIGLDPPPGGEGKYDANQTVTASIVATLMEAPPNGQLVALRGIQFDYQMSTDVVLPDTMSFTGLSALYAAFPDLPIPAAVYIGTAHIPGLMVELPLGMPVELGTLVFQTIDPDVNTIGILDVVNEGVGDPNQGFNLSFGFGVDPDDPITDVNFDNGGAGGMGFVEVPTVPEPASLVLLALGAAAALRGRRGRA